jgi:hypothetical protein
VCDGSYKPSSKRRILAEKSKGLCRQIVIANIDDAIVLQVLSDALYGVIKDRAPTTKSFFAPEEITASLKHSGQRMGRHATEV